jgi:hypothetical protein
VKVENGTVHGGRAGAIATALIGKGFNPATYGANAPTNTATTTTLTYGPGQQTEAQTVAGALGLTSSHLKQGASAGIVLVVGADWPTGTAFPGGKTTPAPADTHTALANSHAQTADQSKTCAKVSKYKTVDINGTPMTPTQAYAASPGIKNSDA